MNNVANKGTALITGASSGIGAVYAEHLAQRGHDLILVARNVERLNAVAERIRAASGRNVTVVQADLGLAGDLAKVEAILRENSSISVLVNNAGFGAVTPLLDSDLGRMKAMIDLNVTALTGLAYAAAPGFVARGQGTIINIASIVSIAVEILNGVYGATKAYVLALSQSMQHELGDKGVRIQAVLPGATATEFWDIAGMAHSNLPQSWVMSAEDMVTAALVGLDQGEVVTIPSLHDADEWPSYEAARKAMSAHLSNSSPAPRYLAGTTR